MFQLLCFSPFFIIILSLLLLLSGEKFARYSGGWGALICAIVLALSCGLLPQTLQPLVSPSLSWFSAIDASISFRLDRLSLLFVMLISGIGVFIFLYAQIYMAKDTHKRQFFSYLLLFTGAMIGLVSANNLLLLFIFWELTTISSYLLIGYKHEKAAAREAALQGLLVTVAGGLGFLVAIMLIYQNAGTLDITVLLAQPDTLLQSGYLNAIMLLLLLAIVTKSAQFPFHFWLPGAMQAPTPVSAYLHSATMVNAGIYLLARFHFIFTHASLGYPLLTAIGLLTMGAGAWLAVRQYDLKLILAYTTVFALGVMVYLLAGDSAAAVAAALFFLLTHALYKAGLFMLAGYVDKQYGTRDIRQIRGLWHMSPIAALALIVGAATMAGLPPFLGFLSKQLIFEAKLAKPEVAWSLEALSMLASFFIALQSIRLVSICFGKLSEKIIPVRFYQYLLPNIMILALSILMIGFWPELLDKSTLIQVAATVVSQKTWTGNLAELSWNTLSAGLALITVTGGFLLYSGKTLLARLAEKLAVLDRMGPEAVYQASIKQLPLFAQRLSGLFQNGNLQTYIATLWLFLLLVVWLYVPLPLGTILWRGLGDISKDLYLGDVSLMSLLVIGAFAIIFLRSTIAALAMLGGLGLVMALVFLVHGAPDVAMTQVLVEILILIFFVINLYRLPTLHENFKIRRIPQLASIGISILTGALITGMMIAILAMPFSRHISDYYIQNSLLKAYGSNVVNVILVDFRGIDTLGEILVIAAAAVGVFGLIRAHGIRKLYATLHMNSLILRISSSTILQLMFIFSLFMLWRGHNQIGGGFIGGLIAACALILFYMSQHHEAKPAIIFRRWHIFLVGGAVLSIVSIALSMLAGLQPFTGLWISFHALGSEVKLGTPFLFDLGVYAMVIGAMVSMAYVLEE